MTKLEMAAYKWPF